jgi:hypothetical protein
MRVITCQLSFLIIISGIIETKIHPVRNTICFTEISAVQV